MNIATHQRARYILFHLLLSHTLLFNKHTFCFKHSILLMVKCT